MTLLAIRVIVLVAGTAALCHALITGRIHIKGGTWITTRSMPRNPIVRAESPRDYWFVLGVMASIFIMLVGFLFMVI